MKLGMGWLGFGSFFLHARRKPNVEAFDRKLAGNQAREEEVAGLSECRIGGKKRLKLGKYRFCEIIELLDQRPLLESRLG